MVNDPSSSFAAAPASETDRRTDTERTVARVAFYVRRAVKLCSFTRCLYRYSADPQWFLAAQHNICANVQQLVTRSSSGRSRNCPSHGLPFQSFPAAKRPLKSRWGLERSDVSSLYGPRRRPIAKRFLCFFESRNRCLLQQFAKHSKLMTGDIFHGQKNVLYVGGMHSPHPHPMDQPLSPPTRNQADRTLYPFQYSLLPNRSVFSLCGFDIMISRYFDSEYHVVIRQ